MPRRKAAVKAASEPPPSSLTKERFQAELKDLASKAKEEDWRTHALSQARIYAKTAFVLSMLAVYSHVSQLALSPVFGSIPSAMWHSRVLMAGCFIGWAGNLALERSLPMTTAQALPLVAVSVPTVQFMLYQFSDQLGPRLGPAVIEGLTLFPLAALTASCAANLLEGAQLTALPSSVADAVPGVASWTFFNIVAGVSRRSIYAVVGKSLLLTRVGLELLLAAMYAVFGPSKYLVYVLPALLHTAVLNTHVSTPAATARLSDTLRSSDWVLLDRKESLTGYISVIESVEQGFRALRCDHSLLGGLWVRSREGEEMSETIYGVFTMLEAVRLAVTEKPVADNAAHALVVGLGVGITPSAFVSHGIDTTVVEIDPAVYDFATKYFNYRENRPPVLEDAIGYASKLVGESTKKFDYIIHDVFTGGAEPVDLFTVEFLQDLHDLLKPEGVIAINYAGDFMLPAARTIVRTIKEVFPTCRLFRESAANETAIAQEGVDFTNMVVFCKKTTRPLTFRRPVAKDLLQSQARAMFLEPKHEVLVDDLLSGEDVGILWRNSTGKMMKWQGASAVGHWKLMRTVIPAKVWEMW